MLITNCQPDPLVSLGNHAQSYYICENDSIIDNGPNVFLKELSRRQAEGGTSMSQSSSEETSQRLQSKLPSSRWISLQPEDVYYSALVYLVSAIRHGT